MGSQQTEKELRVKSLFESMIKGDWVAICDICREEPKTHTKKFTSSGDTLLHLAVAEGKVDVVETLVEMIVQTGNKKIKKEALVARNMRKNTPLHLAASLGNVRMCKYIAQASTDIIGARNVDEATGRDVIGGPNVDESANDGPDPDVIVARIVEEAAGPDVIGARNVKGETPFFLAAAHGKLEAFLCLHYFRKEEVLTHATRTDGVTVLHAAIHGGYFELAFTIIHLYPELVDLPNEKGLSPLHLLATKPSAFKSGSHLSWFSGIISHCIIAEQLEEVTDEDLAKRYENSITKETSRNPPNYLETCISFFQHLYNIIVGVVASTINSKKKNDQENNKQLDAEKGQEGVDRLKGSTKELNEESSPRNYPENYNTSMRFHDIIFRVLESVRMLKMREKKEQHIRAVQVMKKLIENTSIYKYQDIRGHPWDLSSEDESPNTQVENQDENQQGKKLGPVKEKPVKEKPVETPLLIAARHGVKEMVEMILEHFPLAIYDTNSENKNILLVTVESRQPHIYQLLVERNITMKDIVFSQIDIKGNSALHLAATLDDNYTPWLIPGAALQMQWEFKWYEFVKNAVPPHLFLRYNNDGETPEDIFTRTHKNLVHEGGKWLTKTSNSCSVVTALIATVAFATSTAVPGGVDEQKGTPRLENEPAFNMFAISSLIALCVSVTALVMYLSILTSRYQEKDFKKDLPRKLLIGLSSLFISIAAILISFCAGHFFVLKDKLNHGAYPIYAVTCLPITFFAVAQFPLYFDLVRANFKKIPQRKFNVAGTKEVLRDRVITIMNVAGTKEVLRDQAITIERIN